MKTFDDIISEDKKDIQYRFEVSSNLRKLSRIQKYLIDTIQLLNEMTDEIRKLKRSANLSSEAEKIANNIAKQIDGIIFQLRDATYKGDNIHVEYRLEEIEKDYIKLKDLSVEKEKKKSKDTKNQKKKIKIK